MYLDSKGDGELSYGAGTAEQKAGVRYDQERGKNIVSK